MKLGNRLCALAFTLALGLGIWTLAAVDFAPVTSSFQPGDTVSAEAFNELFGTIDENFAAAETAINSKLDAEQVNSVSWSLTGNSGLTGHAPPFLGTTDDSPLQMRVNDAAALTILPEVHPEYGFAPLILGGHAGRGGNVAGATVAGGGSSDSLNVVLADFATISGGRGNQAGGRDESAFPPTPTGIYATVSGGLDNRATGDYAIIGGGSENEAGELWATVGGGWANRANSRFGTIAGGVANKTEAGLQNTVGGGIGNTASGDFATVPGGINNKALGTGSLAAGNYANADHEGVFIWADRSTSDPFHSMLANEFIVRASGGFRFFTNSELTTGCRLATTSWNCVSSRNVKENFIPVDGLEILDKLSQVPILEWNLKGHDPSVRHLGPVAQDFYAAFGLGESDTHLGSADVDGVALAAIQGLHQLMEEQDARIAALEQQNAELHRVVLELAGRLEPQAGSESDLVANTHIGVTRR